MEKAQEVEHDEKSPTKQVKGIIDTVRNDQGLKVIEAYTGDLEWDPAEEKHLVKRIDRRLMSIICITYALQFFDKTILSQAALFGIIADLDLGVGNRYSFSASIFYLGFIAGAYPAIYMAQRWPIERVASDPVRAKGFDDRERYIAVARLRANNSGVRNTHFKIEQVWEALLDLKFWLVFASSFLMMIANGPVSTFIPLIINSFGFSSLNSLLLVMPSGIIIGSIELGVCILAYNLLLWQLPREQKGGLLFGTYFLASFGGGYAILMGLQVANTSGYSKRSFTSSGIFMGYCLGNFVGPIVFKEEDAPVYAPGFIIVLVTSIAALILVVIYRYVAIYENRQRDKSGIMEGFDNAFDDDLTDKKNPQFRYTL
ncbi:hypothetical protein FQN50_001424 [Emmonsiellopsis sp. PD_5]|nr:hypothetical protein FQN50_001424 [Emmonsiellopsis sp. PD_5]